MDYKIEIAKLVLGAVGTIEADAAEIAAAVEIPPESRMGDFALPCFRFSKTLKKSPNAIAAELCGKINNSPVFNKIAAEGPYLNFFVNRAMFVKNILPEILEKGLGYGASGEGNGKTVVIDYSSPNVTHEFHIGHLLSTSIGAALYRIYKFLGYNTVGINYVGDWGAQFGKLVCAYKLWSSEELVKTGGIAELTRIYVKFHDEAEKDQSLAEEARGWLVRMENGDSEALSAWKWIKDILVSRICETYDRLGITFDSWRGESYYNDKMAPVVEEIRGTGLLKESDGAQIVDLEAYKMPPCLILRSDGGTLYHSRDIAAALDRKKTYDFHKSIYVTDMRQSLHFAQFFKVLELMGYEWSKDMYHVPYGLLSLETGPLSARKGNTVLLEDLFDEAVSRVLEIINEKNPLLPGKENIAEDVGVGAVLFGILYTSRMKDMVFSWKTALNFDGETGPYVQYTHARAVSVLYKSGEDTDKLRKDVLNCDFSILADDASFELIKELAAYPGKIADAAEKFEPFIISRALVDISGAFNKFYHENPVLNSAGDVRKVRLALVVCVKDVLKTGLALLGIKAPEQM